jgi:outer membrane lipoprotein-sorting protein
MKKLTSLGIAACAIVLSISLLAGCATSAPASPDESSPPPSAPSSTETTTPSPSEPEPSQPSGDTLDDILSLTSGIGSVKFDMVMTGGGMPSLTTKVWLKGEKMKTEATMEGQTVINIIDHGTQTMYMYMPEQNMAFRVTYEQAQGSPVEETMAISQYHPQNLGTETIDGKVCLVVEYTVQGASTTMWIWEEHGFPIKVVTVTDQGTTTIEYKNIQFTDIPDSEFELPPGVQIMDMP